MKHSCRWRLGVCAAVLIAPLWLVAAEDGEDAAANGKYEVERDVVFSKVDDVELKLDAFIPVADGPLPAVLVVHGGAWRGGNKRQLGFYAESLAKRGYVAFAISYRLAPAHKFPAQIDDCRSAVCWVRENEAKYKVDSDRLGAIGYSAGGHLVALLGTTGKPPCDENGNVDTRLQAVVSGGAPCEFRSVPERSPVLSFWLDGTRKDKPENYKNASPTAFASKDSPPMFFFNGTKDVLVPVNRTKPLVDELKKHGVDAELYEIDGAGHIQAARNNEALAKSWQFFDKHLKSIKNNRVIE